MGWYTVTKRIKGIAYLYRQRTYREGGKVKTESHYLGRADGGGRAGTVIVKSDDTDEAKSVPIGVNTTRYAFHGAREGFAGAPRPSEGGNLGAGFYLTTEARSELFAQHSSKVAAFYADEVEPEFDGEVVEFDTRRLRCKEFNGWMDYFDTCGAMCGRDGFVTPADQVTLRERFAAEGFDGIKIIDDEHPELVVFPDAVAKLRQIDPKLTLRPAADLIQKRLRSKAFAKFLEPNSVGNFVVGFLPRGLRSALPFRSRELILSAETKAKNSHRHPEVDAAAYRAIQDMLDRGERVRDRHDRALVIFHKRARRWWRLAIKCTRFGEPFLLSYHRSSERHYRNRKRLSQGEPFDVRQGEDRP